MVAEAFLAALQPAALQACLAAAQQLEDGHDSALAQWRRQVEQARYEAGRAERRYRAVDPDNRLVARGLETEWNTALQALADAEAELARRETARPKTLTPQEKSVILALGDDLAEAWSAPTTTDKDRKQLLRSLLDEININVHRDHTDAHAELLLRWKGGAITDLSVPIKRKPINRLRTAEDTVDLIEQVKGILMIVYRIDADAAFDLLKWRSQAANIKLRVLADQLLADFRALNYDDTLPPRPVFDPLLLTAHNRVRR